MKLRKKWESRSVYRTSRGTADVKRDGDYAVVETSNPLLAKALIMLHGFKEYVSVDRVLDTARKSPPVTMAKPPVTKSKKPKEEVVKPKPRTRKKTTRRTKKD